jgi:hypothetical protein
MRILAVAIVLMTIFCSQALAGNCNIFASGQKECSGFQTFAWVATAPVWLPLGVVYLLLGGELPEQQGKREAEQLRVREAWQRLTPEERQGVIQLRQFELMEQQEQRAQQLRTLQTLEAIQRLQQPRTMGYTSCTPDMMGGFDCLEW